jgi:hypothetical protein
MEAADDGEHVVDVEGLVNQRDGEAAAQRLVFRRQRRIQPRQQGETVRVYLPVWFQMPQESCQAARG